MSTSFKGPILGNADSMAGALSGAPVGLFADSRWGVYFNDFNHAGIDYVESIGQWTATPVSFGGTALIVEGNDNGILRLDCPNNLDGPIVQFDSEAAAGLSILGVTPTAGSATASESDALFVSRFRISNVLTEGIFVGLAELNASSPVIGTPGGAITSDTHIGFSQAAGDNGSLIFSAAGSVAAAAEATTSVVTLANLEWVDIAVRARGTGHYAGYVKKGGQNSNWAKVAEGTLASPWNAQMLITFANLGAGTGDDLDIDYCSLSVKRDLIA